MNALRCFVLLALAPALVRGQSPPDLAMIPSDAMGFVHLRISDVWKHDLMKNARDAVAAAGPRAYAAWEKQVYPNPADLERGTVILLPGMRPNGAPDVIVVLAFKSELDTALLKKCHLPEGKVMDWAGHAVVVDSDRDMAMTVHNKTMLLAGPGHAVEQYLARKTIATGGALAPAVKAAATKALTIGVNVRSLPIPPQAMNDIPPDLRPLAMADTVMLTADIASPDPLIQFDALYASGDAAADAEKAFKVAIMMAKQAMKQPKAEMEQKLFARENKGPRTLEKMAEATMALAAIGGITMAEKMLDTLPVTRSGNAMTAKVTIPKEVMQLGGVYTGAMVGLLLPAVQKVREAASRSQSQNNLKQMGLAMHSMHDAYGKLPAAAVCDKAGKPLLSWRVAVLPYIEQDALYRQFKLDEPWDSPNNKPLIAMMPRIFASPRYELKPGETCYKVFVGKEALFDVNEGRKFLQVTDGLSNTVMIVEAGDPVAWTKPEDLEFDSTKPLPKLTLPGGIRTVNVALADGSVRLINLDNVKEATWKIVIGIRDGMVPPGDWDGNGGAAPAEMRLVPRAGTPATPTQEAVPPPARK